MTTNAAAASQDGPRQLWCLLEGKDFVFPVTVDNCQVFKLKDVIHDTLKVPKDVYPYSLKLWKVDIDLNIQGDEHSLSQLNGEGNEKLESWMPILECWPEQPPEDHLHVIVKIPPANVLSTEYMGNLSPSFGCGSDSWPCTLVIYRDDLPGQDASYEPKSDFFAALQGIPHIIMEVKSNSEEDGEKRMLAQGASLVRIANKTLVENGYKADFILMAMYFEYTIINRYLLCQKDESDESDGRDKNGVYCFKEQFLNNQWDRARLLQQMYNLASKEEGVEMLGKLKNKFNALSQQIGNLPAYTAMQQLKRNETQNNQNAPFKADGYELVDKVPALTAHIYIVQRRKDRKQLIAKVTRDSVEEEILEFLHTRESPCEHIIPLIGSFSSNKGPGILLPIRQPILPLLARPEKHRSRFLQFGEDLINGLAFIHSHCVTHRDIKPDNLVYTDTFLLQIIDFDAATEVFDSDDLLEEEVGSSGYMAPETRDRHSPIRADRWSCGLVILRFLRCSDGEGQQYKKMEEFARRLKDEDPWRRPSLCEWMELSKGERDKVKMEVSPRKKRRVEDYETEFQSNAAFMAEPGYSVNGHHLLL